MDDELRFQDPGEGLHEAEIIDVLVAEGDRVEEGQPVLNVETDKATFEVSSPRAGTVANIRVSPGDRVQVGDALLSFSAQTDGDGARPRRSEADRERAEEKPQRPREPAQRPPAAREPQPERKAEPAPKKSPTPVPATPATRRLARELDVDLHAVEPSGQAGRVLDRDVRDHAERRGRAEKPGKAIAREPEAPRPRAPELPDFSKWGPIERVEWRGARRTMAHRMALSWSEVPHVNHQESADITELEALRQRLSPGIEARGGKLTLTVLVMRAAVATLREFPRLNASFDSEHEQLVLKQYYRIGVAVDTERGLLVPVVQAPESKSLAELSRELVELFERTRRGENAHGEMTGGTFTITNIGGIGGTRFTPIINYPEVAILGLARADLTPTVAGSRIEPRLLLPLSLSFDHRAVDGAEAARFMARLRERLSSADAFLADC